MEGSPSSRLCADQEVALFKSLIYNSYTFVNRCRFLCRLGDPAEFYLLQGANQLICKRHSYILEKVGHGVDADSKLDVYHAALAAELNRLCETRLVWDTSLERQPASPKAPPSDTDSRVAWDATGVSVESTDVNKYDSERVALEMAFINLGRRLSFNYMSSPSCFDEHFYKCFLYCDSSDNDGGRKSFDMRPLGLDTDVILRLCRDPPTIGKVCDNIHRYRAECRYKLLHDEDSSDSESELTSDESDVESSVPVHESDSFQMAIVMLWSKVVSQSFMFNIRMWQLEGRNIGYIGDQLLSHLKDLLDDVLRCPCDYRKWSRIVLSNDPFKSLDITGSTAYESVYHYLRQILNFAHSNNLSRVFDLCIDLMFCISLRHPNPCVALDCVLNYMRTVLIPSLPCPCEDYGNCGFDESGVWLPRLSGYFDSLLDFEYLSLHHPLSLNYNVEESEDGCDSTFVTSIPRVGCYILRVDISIDETSRSSNIHNPACTSTLFRICISAPTDSSYSGSSITFVSDGHHMMVFDSGFTMIDLHSQKTYYLEFLFDTSNLLVFLNGVRFYMLNLAECWMLESSGFGDLGMSISFDESTVSMWTPCSLSPGFRSEMMLRRVVLGCGFSSGPEHGGCLLDSLYDRHLYLLKVTSAIHKMSSRILHVFKEQSSGASTWSAAFVRYIRLLFEILFCNLECIDSICTYFTSSESVNAFTLWRLISDSILSVVSTMHLLLSIPKTAPKLPHDMLELIASCFVGCLRFRPIVSTSEQTDLYHLQFDLDSTASAINMSALRLLSSCPGIFNQIFSSLRLEVLVDLLVSTVSVEQFPSNDSLILGDSIDALKSLSEADCIAIFTKRALSQNMPCFSDDENPDAKIDNHWWNTIKSFLSAEKDHLSDSRAWMEGTSNAYCTCESPSFGLAVSSPSFVCCYGCLRSHRTSPDGKFKYGCFEDAHGVSSYYSSPRPRMVLCRLLLKHGILFLCLNISVSYKEVGLTSSSLLSSILSNDYEKNSERFGDWKGNIVYSRDDDFLKVKNASKYFRLFNRDDILVLEQITLHLLRYNEFVFGLLSENLHEVSSDLLNDFASSVHNFINALSITDILSYMMELFESLPMIKGNPAVIHQSFITCGNLIPSMMQVIIWSYTCTKRYFSMFEESSLFINYVSLQLHSLVHLLGRFMVYMYNNCKCFTKDHLLSKCQVERPPENLLQAKLMNLQDGMSIPPWLLRGTWLELDDRSGLYSSLNRLAMLLQDFKYEGGSSTFTSDLDTNRPLLCKGTSWALGILDGDESAIKRLLPNYVEAHPSLSKCQLCITAVFIHLLDSDSATVDIAVRFASQIVLQLLRQFQSIQAFSTGAPQSKENPNLRQHYVDDICNRCAWLVNNTRGALYYAKTEVITSSVKSVYRANDNVIDTCGGLKRSSSSTYLELNSNHSPVIPGTCSEGLLRPRIGRSRLTALVHSHSADSVKDNNMATQPWSGTSRFDIRFHQSEITTFLLYGPTADACECDLYAVRLSTLCRYTMWRCMNLLICLISDMIFIGGEGEDEDEPSMVQPLLLNLLYERDTSGFTIASDGMHSLLKLLWYNLVKTARSMVIRSANDDVLSTDPSGHNDSSNMFECLLLTTQSLVLKKMCDWYLRSGVRFMDYARYYGSHLSSWVRISLPFFGLLFSLGIDPLKNSRYATPIFQHLLNVLQPLHVNSAGETEFDSYGKVGIGSIIVLFISYNVLRMCSVSVNSLFHLLWTEKYSKKDFKKVKKGLLYLWVKNACDMQPSVMKRKDELRFQLLWSLGELNLCTAESDLESLNNVIRSLEEVAEVVPSDTSEVMVWHMFPSVKCDISGASFIDRYNAALSSDVDLRDTTIPVYIEISMKSATPGIGESYMGFLHQLGGKLEVETGNGIWSQFHGSEALKSVHHMRTHLHYLLHFMLWTSFSSNLYATDGDLSNIDISCCLCRLLLKSLREVASMLVVFNGNCSCSEGIGTPPDSVSFRYIPSSIDSKLTSVSVKGMISSTCVKCTGNMLYRSEVENFWLSVLTILLKEIDSTAHYGMVHYILNCLLTTFTLGDDEIDVLLSSPSLGPAFCELFVVCTRRLGQEHLSESDYLIPTAEIDSRNLVSPALHGMFLYRWLPPLQRSPSECLYSSVREIFQSIVMREGYKKNIQDIKDSNNDPFSTLPHSDNFVTHRTSADFEAEINGNTLHVTRALNMGGIVLFRIPLRVGSTSSMRGTVNFFILSPGRFGITVAPADCVFGSVIDLFDRNDVVGFMTTLCPPFVHDVFAATINYRVGDVLSASFTIDHQEDGQICLRTELLIAGNSIGSVLEVVYDPATQNDPMRRMSLVFIFQDPQTAVYNGLTDVSSPVSDRLVSRETQSTFRSDSASEHLVELPVYSEESRVSTRRSARHVSILSPSIPASSPHAFVNANNVEGDEHGGAIGSDDFSVSSDDDREISLENSPSLEKFINTDWDLYYDINEDSDDETTPADVLRLCKDDMWQGVVNRRGTLTDVKSAIMFAESVQLYQSILTTNVPLLSGLKEEVVGQMCLSFETLYYKLMSCPDGLGIAEDAVRDCFSWLCVLGCDIDSEAWKRKLCYSREGKLEKISDFTLPWLLGSSSTSRSCVSRLSGDSCRKLLISLSHLLSLPCVSCLLLYTVSKHACADYTSLPDFVTSSLLLALAAKCLLCCIMVGRVLCEKGCTFDVSDPMTSEYICIDQLATVVYKFLSNEDTSEAYLSSCRVAKLLSVLGISSGSPSETETSSTPTSSSASSSGCSPRSQHNDRIPTPTAVRKDHVSREQFWQILYDGIKSNNMVDDVIVRTIDGRQVQDLTPNPKMFATCDYTFHCGSRIPSSRRHLLRRTLCYGTTEHDVYDLSSMLILLSPDYFASKIFGIDHEKGLRIFRSSVMHFVRGYDFNCTDYWQWVYVGGAEGNPVSVKSIDLFSRTADPLYGWQRLFYMEKCIERLTLFTDILFTELLYCIGLLLYDSRRYFGLCDVVHWILDSLLRHPLCSGMIRQRFVSNYVWSIVHTLLINCSALPCKLAVVSTRLTAWLIPVSSELQLNRMLLVTHHCGTSALHRVTALCNFFNILDLDTFTNIDLKRHDHATKLATAMLVHLFASALALLLERDCEPINTESDDILSISHYMLIAKHPTMYSEQFIRHLLGISQDLSLHASIPTYYRDSGCNSGARMTHTFITASHFRTLSLLCHVNTRCRTVICNDRECRKIVTETLFYPDMSIKARSWNPEFVDYSGPYSLEVLRHNCCLPAIFIAREKTDSFKDVTFRCGFLARGIDDLSSPSSKVHFEGDHVYLEVMCESEISQRVINNEVVWHYGQTTICLSLPSNVELLRPFIEVIHPSDPDYTENITVRRNSLSMPMSSMCYYVASDCKPQLKQSLGFLRMNPCFRSGVSLSGKDATLDVSNAVHMEMSLAKDIVEGTDVVDLSCMNSHMSLPFSVSCIVRSSNPNFYVGLEWLGLRFLWMASGNIQCPLDAPVYKHGIVSTSHVSLPAAGFSAGDTICLRFMPEDQSLLFILNDAVRMILDFRHFYRPKTLLHITEKALEVPQLDSLDGDLRTLQDMLFDAIISDNIPTVCSVVSFVMDSSTPDKLRVFLFETPLLENMETGSTRKPHDQYNALDLCCVLNRLAILKHIAVLNVDFDHRSGSSLETPLMAASRNGCNAIISYLVCVLRVDVNTRDRFGNTALMHALREPDPLQNDGNERNIIDTVELLISLGCDILAKNESGCTVLDMIPTKHRGNRELCNYLIEQHKLRKAYHSVHDDVHRSWPGLLGGCEFVCGNADGDTLNLEEVSLHAVWVDGINLLVDHCNFDKMFDASDRVTISSTASVEYIESSLERIRKAVVSLISKWSFNDSSKLPYLSSCARLKRNPAALGTELVRYLRGFVQELMRHRRWTKCRPLCNLARLSLELCNCLPDITDNSEILFAFLNFERCVGQLRLLPHKDSSPISTIQTYRELFQGSNLLYCDYSLYSNDYLALSYLNCLSKYLGTFNDHRLRDLEFGAHDIPTFCGDRIKINVSAQSYAFNRVRHNVNRDITKDVDFAIHCIADLLNSSPSTKQLITAMVVKCRTTFDVQTYLPPLDSSLWSGIYTTMENLLDCFVKLRSILSNHLEQERLDKVEVFLLLEHLLKIVEDDTLKTQITKSPSGYDTHKGLREIVEKLQLVDVGLSPKDGEIRITNYSNMDGYALSSHRSEVGSARTADSRACIFAAFCYVIINDRISLLDHVNDTFKLVAPIIGTVLNQPLVEYLPLDHQLLRPYNQFVEAPHCLSSEMLVLEKRDTGSKRCASSHREMGICLGPSELPVHWSVYFGNRSLIRRSLINDMYRKIFVSLQSLNRERPYFSIRVDRGISATAFSLKHTLWYQSCAQLLNCNPNILRARHNQRPFMVVFKGEGATDFGGPFQELLSCISNEVMHPLSLDSRLNKMGQVACTKCSNSINSYGLNQDTVMFKLSSGIHPMVKLLLKQDDIFDSSKLLLRCGDLGISCSSGCCTLLSPMFHKDEPMKEANFRNHCRCGGSESHGEHCNQGVPIELAMYESLGRLFAMCVCMMNPLNVALNPIIWKKLLASNLSLRDLADCDKLSSDLLYKLKHSPNRFNLLNDLTFSLESNDGLTSELLSDGANISVTEGNLDLFLSLATLFRLTQGDISSTWLARGFNAVLPIGRFRMLLDHKLLEFMVCGDPRIDLEVLRAHTVSSSVTLKRELFDVLANFENVKMQMFLRFVSGRSRLPPAQSEWSLFVEYEPPKDGSDDPDKRLPTSSTCSFRLMMPRYTSKEIMRQRLLYAIQHCMAIDLDAYHVHDSMELNV